MPAGPATTTLLCDYRSAVQPTPLTGAAHQRIGQNERHVSQAGQWTHLSPALFSTVKSLREQVIHLILHCQPTQRAAQSRGFSVWNRKWLGPWTANLSPGSSSLLTCRNSFLSSSDVSNIRVTRVSALILDLALSQTVAHYKPSSKPDLGRQINQYYIAIWVLLIKQTLIFLLHFGNNSPSEIVLVMMYDVIWSLIE